MGVFNEPCTQAHGQTGVFVRDLAAGHERAIMTSANRCDSFGPAAWNTSGTELVFPANRAVGRAHTGIGGQLFCPVARNKLAVASADPGSTARALRLLPPDRGCEFRAAAFDREGIVAVEGCRQGGPKGFSDASLGDAYLLQFGRNDRLIRRVGLERGLEEAEVATDPGTGNVLVTQDQPANQGPEYDWVWEFDGTRLRLIARYGANDAAQVIAIPW